VTADSGHGDGGRDPGRGENARDRPDSSIHLGPLDALVFLGELAVLVGVGLGGLALGSSPALGVAWGMLGVGLMVFLWSRYGAPRAVKPLRGGARAAFILAWFTVGALGWWPAGRPLVGVTVAVVGLVAAARAPRRH